MCITIDDIAMHIVLFPEYEVYCEDEAQEGCDMVPVEFFSLKQESGNDCEHGQGGGFLYHFQLHQCEGASVSCEAGSVGGYHEAVFEECDAP